MDLVKCFPANNERVAHVVRKFTKTEDMKKYKAEYYIKNIEKYTERSKKYRDKKKALKEGIYIEPVKEIIIKKKE